MIKRLKLLLIILLGAVAAACVAAGCSVGIHGKEDILSDYKGGHVTYYANGGYFNSNTEIVIRDVYYKTADVPFFDIPADSGDTSVMWAGYDFMGWYAPARYESGEHAGEIMYVYAETEEPVFFLLDDDGNQMTDNFEARPLFHREGKDEQILESDVRVVASDELITSEKIIAADEELVVCAKWEASLKFVFKLATDDKDKTYYFENNTACKYGDVISELNFGKNQTNNPGETLSVRLNGMTFVSNYADEACTQSVGTYNRDDYESGAEIVIWSKFIEGSWTVVRSRASEVQSMFNGLSNASNKYYLISDIDCSTVTNFGLGRNVSATVEGNGHTLSGINITNNSVGNGLTVGGLFGNISASASIRNLTIKDVKVTLSGRGSIYFYGICTSVADGAEIVNLTVENLTASVTFSGGLDNDNASTHWLIGGSGADEELAQKYGITVSGENTLTIN